MATVTVDAKGRLAIPSEVRSELGIKPGDVLFIESDPDRQVMRLAKAINPLDALAEYAESEYRAGRTRSLRSFAKEQSTGVDSE